jgi:colicin import membrane protein
VNEQTYTLSDQSEVVFKRFLIISLSLHLALVLAGTVKSLFSSKDMLIVPNAVRVDMVALPDKLPENITPAKPTPVQKAEPVKIPTKPQEKKENLKDSQKKALERLNAMNALDKIKKEVAQNQKSKEQATEPAPSVPQYKGNVISSGNSFTGMSRLRVNEYLENLTSKIRENWVLPQWLNNPGLKAAIVIEVDARGYIIKKEVHTSSGNSVFDSSCLAAVTDASPFEPPPNEVREAMIMIRFPFE